MNVSFRVQNDYLLALCSGKWEPKAIRSALISIEKAVSTYHKDHLLIDWRGVLKPLTDYFRFELGEQLALRFRNPIQIAMIVNNRLENQFMEDAAVNRGAFLKLFENESGAVTWLDEPVDLEAEEVTALKSFQVPSWRKDFELGIAEIDFQHQYFLKLVHRFSDLGEGQVSREKMTRYLDELVYYARFHFCSEENVMQECGYPELPAHKLQHEKLIHDLSVVIDAAEAVDFSTSSISEFLVEWFLTHTVTEDHLIAEFLQQS